MYAGREQTSHAWNVQADWGHQDALGKANLPAQDKQGVVVFRGVRARVGCFHGEVVKVVPHSRTGERLSKEVLDTLFCRAPLYTYIL